MITVTLSGEVHLKSRRTQRRFIAVVADNIAAAAGVPRSQLRRLGGNRMEIDADLDRAAIERVAKVFGVGRVEASTVVAVSSLDDLTREVAAACGQRVATGSYAVRVRRRGSHDWGSMEAEAAVGLALATDTNVVDLTAPDHMVRILVEGKRAWIRDEAWKGPAGLPVGSQEPVLCLLSGGFDSVVAAWMMLSRGCPVHFVHFTLDCAQSDHAIAVAETLQRQWGHGTDPVVHLVDFQPIKRAITIGVPSRMRQVALKVLMARTAAVIADREGIGALLMGDSLGQVSSQTLTHLRAIDEACPLPILRPLLGLDKEWIIARAHEIGTGELSARAKEVCDLSEGLPVAVDAQPAEVARAAAEVPDELIERVAGYAMRFRLADWFPGAYRFEESA